MSRNTKSALVWIESVFRKRKIPFVVWGGFAAKIYGSRRGLADIDIDIQNKKLFDIVPVVKKYIVYGPKIYKDKNFKILLMTLKYKGQLIDVCGSSNQKIFDKKTKKWEIQHEHFSKAVKKKIYNVFVSVVPLHELINYKKKMARRVDLKDVKELEKIIKKRKIRN